MKLTPSAVDIEVLIDNGGGDCPRFSVTVHLFGPQKEGPDHNALMAEWREFIEITLKKALVWRHADNQGIPRPYRAEGRIDAQTAWEVAGIVWP